MAADKFVFIQIDWLKIQGYLIVYKFQTKGNLRRFRFEENPIICLSKQKTKKTNHSTNIVSFRLRPLISSPLIDFILQEQHQILTERKKTTLLTRGELSG